MTTYYRDASVRVTADTVEVGRQRFPVSELSYVWHRRGHPTARTALRGPARAGLIAILLLPLVAGAIVLGRVVGEQYGALATIGAAAIVLLVGSLLLLMLSPLLEYPLMALERSYDRGTEVREIWARWHHREVMLVRTTDAARFGRIYRALERAIEQDED